MAGSGCHGVRWKSCGCLALFWRKRNGLLSMGGVPSTQSPDNGKQNKQYLYVSDAVKGILDFTIDMGPGMDVYNISTESFINVDSIAQLVCERMGADPVYHYTGGSTGWNGDVPSFGFDIDNAMSKGWRYEFDSESAVKETLSKIDIDSIPPME